MQARRLAFVKTFLDCALRKRKRPSIVLRVAPSQHVDKKNCSGRYEEEKSLSSHLCTNDRQARLDQFFWSQENAKLYTMYPQQKVDLYDWLIYPYENSFPLYTNNCRQTFNESDLHVLVEVDIESYGSKASTTAAKLEDYGLIMAWTILSKSMGFIVKTDLDHIVGFMSAIIQGQHFINNGLFVTRVQSVLVSGKPIFTMDLYSDTGHLGPPPDKNSFYALCDAVQARAPQQKPKKGARVRGMSTQSQDNTEFIDQFLEEAVKDMGAKSNSAPATCASSPTKQHVELAKKPHDSNHTPGDALSTVPHGTSHMDVHLPDVTEKLDNTSEEESKNVDQSKSTRETDSKNFGLEKTVNLSKMVKPPNVLICADSVTATDNLQNLLLKVLDEDRYDTHIFQKRDLDSCKVWIDDVSLVVLCGNVGAELSAHLVEYIIHGGKVLALCSDMLHILLPSFKTAEVRENELVHFSYGKWKRVRMMHHIFCYHASPIRTRFSQDHEDARAPALNPPTSTSVKDKKGNLHSFDVKVLGREETWQSPSILLATLPSSGGKVVFSQIHLEIDPMQYVYEGDKYDVLKKSNVARLEIISDLLSTHLGLYVNRDTCKETSVRYTPGYFLGKFEMKMKMLEKLKDKMDKNVLKMSEMQIQFCTSKEDVHSPSSVFLPIMMHMCPPNFSTVVYFDNLYTKDLGRLVIYVDVLTSSMNVIQTPLEHGLTVIPRQQVKGRGRYSNKWLGPIGCAMFTLQVHINIISNIGRYISILQHIAAVALVSAVRSIKGYEDIDLRIKWPNDVYIGSSFKIGGIIVSTLVDGGGSTYFCNIGAGINLSNSKPTTCINDAILQYNQKYGTKLETFSYEKYLALVFNEMENLLDILQSGNTDHFYQLYYKYWLHMNSNVTVTFFNGRREEVIVRGIDNYGYLLVQGQKGMFSVHSDENSFDVLKGLIVPKKQK
ncbi:PREDICTED: biotin--protein ligase isoform X2 [Vollenhovia emeryi]|nr:PREDICTED: biotin--protein ligase isoform X2 [Vollenhovia emeryi]